MYCSRSSLFIRVEACEAACPAVDLIGVKVAARKAQRCHVSRSPTHLRQMCFRKIVLALERTRFDISPCSPAQMLYALYRWDGTPLAQETVS